jgi:hypothetical protein
VRTVPCLCELYPGICLTNRGNHVKPQLGLQQIHHKQTHYRPRTLNSTIHTRNAVTQSITMSQNNKEHIINLSFYSAFSIIYEFLWLVVAEIELSRLDCYSCFLIVTEYSLNYKEVTNFIDPLRGSCAATKTFKIGTSISNQFNFKVLSIYLNCRFIQIQIVRLW